MDLVLSGKLSPRYQSHANVNPADSPSSLTTPIDNRQHPTKQDHRPAVQMLRRRAHQPLVVHPSPISYNVYGVQADPQAKLPVQPLKTRPQLPINHKLDQVSLRGYMILLRTLRLVLLGGDERDQKRSSIRPLPIHLLELRPRIDHQASRSSRGSQHRLRNDYLLLFRMIIERGIDRGRESRVDNEIRIRCKSASSL
jgi:hypothetical protein